MIEPIVLRTQAAAGQTPPTDAQEKARIAAAARDFEAVFVSYMLKSMRSSLKTNDMFGDSFGGDMMNGMFDMEIAKEMSKGKSFGLAEMLYKKLAGEEVHPSGSPESGIAPAVVSPAATRPDSASPAAGTPESRLAPFEEMIRDAAGEHGVDPALIKALIMSESSGRPAIESRRSAKGLMQLLDSTASDMGVKDVWDPRENIFGGTKYLRKLMDRFDGNLRLALASYNAGPATVERYGGIPPYRETREYIERVTQFMNQFKQDDHDSGING
jgi:Rod binding domain-containing protein